METVRLSFVKKEFLVEHSDTLHLVERSSVFSLYRYNKKALVDTYPCLSSIFLALYHTQSASLIISKDKPSSTPFTINYGSTCCLHHFEYDEPQRIIPLKITAV